MDIARAREIDPGIVGTFIGHGIPPGTGAP